MAKKPNILILWGDDIGYWNISAYNLGQMGYRTPNLDRLGKGRCTVHRLVRPTELHGRSGVLHHGPIGLPDGHAESWAPRREGGAAGS